MFYRVHKYIENKYYNELRNLSPALRESMIFKYYTENIPVFIKPNEYIAGWYGYSEEPKFENGANFEIFPVLTEGEKETLKHLATDLKTHVEFHLAHTCIDYEKIITKGLNYYLDKVEKELIKEPSNEFLKAMEISLKAVENFSLRYVECAKELLIKEKCEENKKRLERMINALKNVPMNPAKDFYEALQSVWLMHILLPMAEKSWASISIGRIDQYLYPFYKTSTDSKEEIKNMLKQVFTMLDSYGDGACAMNIGGMDELGNDMMNELSELLIEVEKEMSLRAPIFAVRVNPKTPDEIIDKVIDFNLFKIGQPTFYGDVPCRKAMINRGVDESVAHSFSANSCMGIIMSGSEFANMWAIKFNMHLPLELALNNGKPFNCELKLNLKTKPKEITSFDVLLEQYRLYLEELIEISVKLYYLVAEEQAKNVPDPFLSALTEGCIEKRGDRAFFAKYDTVTIETMGLINTCDALQAIKKLVFKTGKYTLSELVNATKNNFRNAEKLQNNILNTDKYGMNTEETNEICRIIGKFVSESCVSQNADNMIVIPSLHTIDKNVYYGETLYATLDGRKAGEPVNKNANPSMLLKKIEHTSHILSAVSLEQTNFSGGQPIDLYFNKNWFNTKESRDKIKSLILTYFELGGLQLQVNSVDLDLLEKAHKEPNKYPQVIIRKGGFSVRFNELNFNAREDFIEYSKKMNNV